MANNENSVKQGLFAMGDLNVAFQQYFTGPATTILWSKTTRSTLRLATLASNRARGTTGIFTTTATRFSW